MHTMKPAFTQLTRRAAVGGRGASRVCSRRCVSGGFAGAGHVRVFTLLEVIVAMTVFTLVVVIVFAFSSEMTKSWERLRSEKARFSELLTLDRTLDGILSNAVAVEWPDEEGEVYPFFIGEPEAMRCATLHAMNNPRDGAVRFVALELQDNSLLAFYTQRPYLDWGRISDSGRVAVLAEGVGFIEFQYADWSNDDNASWDNRVEWVSEWDPERKELPLAIMMTVQWQDGRVESWLRRTAAQGYRERYGQWQPARKDQETVE
jgi:hypothetical protein